MSKKIKPIIETIKRKVKEHNNRNTSLRPRVLETLNNLEKKYKSPKEYSEIKLKQAVSDFYKFNEALRTKELPLNPKDIKLDPKDPLYTEKSKFKARQIANRLVNNIVPRKVGNLFEIKLTLILRNKKLSSPEKKKQLKDLLLEIDSMQRQFQVDKRIQTLEQEISNNVEKVTNIFKETNSYLENNSVNPVEKKELLDFLELWKRNLRNSDAVLREYKAKLDYLRMLRAKINKSAAQL